MDEGGCLESICGFYAHRGFESHPFRIALWAAAELDLPPKTLEGWPSLAEGTRLESVCTLPGTVGSNPTPSASPADLVVLDGEVAVPCTRNPL